MGDVVTTLRPILERLGPNPTPDQILDLKICDPAMGSGAFLVAVCRFLAELLVKAWHAHKCLPSIPPDEDEILHARRIVAQRCLYGVDKNPMAVDLAKLSLWLATLAKDHPFTFLDHALRHGDSLVGLSKKQIEAFHWKPERQRDFARALIRDRLAPVLANRNEIREAPDATPEPLLSERLHSADGFLDPIRRYGDLVISALFAGANDRQRKEKLEDIATTTAEQLKHFDIERHRRLEAAVHSLRGDRSTHEIPLPKPDHPVIPFHWEIEFPEVFDREDPGFDSFVGNPPFLGGLRVSNSLGMEYFAYLTSTFQEAGHVCDLVAYFFRRCFDLLRDRGSLGLVATNSIAQGDTREGGLGWICENQGTIYSATRRLRWPGRASVVVSLLHIWRGRWSGPLYLDGKAVPRITAFLFTKGGDRSPARLAGMNELFSQGINIRGPGFLFGDGEATSLEEMDNLIRREPAARERILPYSGGEEINQSPVFSPQRYVIYLSDIKTEAELSSFPGLTQIVIQKVKPERDSLGSNPNNIPLKRRWWAYHAERRDFYDLIRAKDKVLVCCQTSKYLSFALLPTTWIFSLKTVIIALNSNAAFASMQSRVNLEWADFLGSSMKDDPVYTPSDCFETFPLPKEFESNQTLESAGRAYNEFRSDLMIRNNEGLTKTYNRFHAPDERSSDILRLRELHAEMDRAVLDAYGWIDLKPTCEFLLDYEEDEDEDETGGTRRRKKPWRYRWPDDFRDEVLARLLELNRQRAEEERRSGAAESGRGKSTKKSTKGRKADTKKPDQPEFFES